MALTVLRTVRPSPKWQETYVRVQKGYRVVIEAEGLWSPDLRNTIGWCGPDGFTDRIAGDGYLLPGVNVGALLARIGDGLSVAVGSRYDFRALTDGQILLAMNENDQYDNQAGTLTAQIIVFM